MKRALSSALVSFAFFGAIQPAMASEYDINDDGVVNVYDIDEMQSLLRWNITGEVIQCTWWLPEFHPFYTCYIYPDLNDDGVFDGADMFELLHSGFQTFYGDINLDQRVDAQDLNIIALNWGSLSNNAYSNGDLSNDGRIDADDLNVLAQVWGFVWGE